MRWPLAVRGALVLFTGFLLGCRSRTPDAPLIISGTSIVDLEAGGVLPDQTIRIQGGRIVGIRPGDVAGEPEGTRPGSQYVDGRGLYAIPGLWDMHVHALWDSTVAESFLPAFARHGVTGIRDMGGDLSVLHQVRRVPETVKRSWPRVVAAGRILDGPHPVDPSISIAVGNAEEGVQAVDALAAEGVDFIKVYTLLPARAYFAVARRARELDLLVAGHLPVDVSVGDAIAAGQVSIEHLRDELGPFCLNADTIDCESLIRQFSTSHIYNTPTLVVLEAKGIPDYRSSSTLAVADDLPRSVDLYWRTSLEEHQARPVEYFAKREAVFEHEMTFVARLAAANAPILAGSDAGNPFIYPGESLHRELELLVNAGLSTQDALLAATLRPARFLGIADTVGAIRVGSVADIVLLEGNPLEDISNVRRVAAVVLRGRLLPKGMGD